MSNKDKVLAFLQAITPRGAWIEIADARVAADFSSKATRRLFESSAVVHGMGTAIEALNL